MLLMTTLYFLLPLVQAAVFIQIQLQFGIWGGVGDLLNYLSSIFAFHWMLSNIILGSKIPWLQRSIPYDKRIRFHIYSSLGISTAVVYHGIYKLALGFQMNLVSVILGTGLFIFLALSLLWIPVPGFKKLRQTLLQLMRGTEKSDYDLSKNLHSLGVMALTLLILIHVLQSGLFQAVPIWSKGLYVVLYFSSLILYILSKTSLFQKEAEILSVEKNGGILTITLKTKEPASYRNGQFAFLKLNNQKGAFREHPFSYLSGGTVNENEDQIIQFAARIVGPFTNELAMLKPGDQVNLRHGFGNFRPDNDSSLCLVGSGIGIVPLISLIEELYEKGDNRNVEAFLSVNSREEFPRLKELQRICAEMENLNLNLLVYEEDQTLYSLEYFRERLAAPENYRYYLCSSPGVRSAVLSVLRTLGVKRSNIHFEAFSFG